jgi:hypothetical protein
MPRRREVPKREILPDPKYGNVELAKFMNVIMKGGKEYPGENVVAGKPDASWLVKTMTLPDSDDLAMPPEGKGDRVTPANIDLIKKWITEGANFGAWKGVE